MRLRKHVRAKKKEEYTQYNNNNKKRIRIRDEKQTKSIQSFKRQTMSEQ